MYPTLRNDDKIYRICRELSTFSSLPDGQLRQEITASIEIYYKDLSEFDSSLPKHLIQGLEATWLEFTCVTVHICNILSNHCLSQAQGAAMARHIDILYRVDDWMEGVCDRYGVRDLCAATTLFNDCLSLYIGVDPSRSNQSLSHTRSDSPLSQDPPIYHLALLSQDFQTILRLMHSHPMPTTHPQDRQWYTLELHSFFAAQISRLAALPPIHKSPSSIYSWTIDIGARSVGTKYMFAMFSCLISTDTESPCWATPLETYLAQDFAQQLSVEFRLLNDIGGRERDEKDGTMSSCLLVHSGETAGLEEIAKYARDCSHVLLDRIEETLARRLGAQEAEKRRLLLEMYRRTVRLSGELYMANEPNRTAL